MPRAITPTTEPDCEHAGRVIRHLRASRGLTQSELADTAGVSRRTLQHMESGGPSHLSSYGRVARALSVSLGQLIHPPQTGDAA